MSEYLVKTDPILFEAMDKGITDKVLISLGKVLMPYQIDWFIHIHKIYDVISRDAEVQIDKKKLNLPFDQRVLNLSDLINKTISKHGNRYVDFILTFALYSKLFDDQALIPEDNLIYFSNKNDCYYFKPSVDSKTLDDEATNIKDFQLSESLSDFTKVAKEYQLTE